MAGNSFLSDADILALRQTFADGMATVEAFEAPQQAIQFRRMGASGMEDVGDPVWPISVKFGLREGNTTQAPQLEQQFSDGDMLLWADGFIPVPGDRFTWLGHGVQVEKVYPEYQGTIEVEIRLQQVST